MRLRRSALVLTAALLAGGTSLSTATPAGAVPTPVCSETDATFCFSADLSVTVPGSATPEDRAGAPADYTFSLENTSADHLSNNKNHWLGQLGVNLVKGLGGSFATPSAQLDNNLLVAGTSAGCAQGADNSFSECTAGHGVVVADVTGSGFPGVDGFHTGTFGVQKIYNINPPTAGYVIDWNAVLELCVNTPLGACNASGPQEVNVSIRSASGATAGSLVLNTTAAFDFSSVHVDGSLDSLEGVTLLGSSETLANGSAASKVQTVLHLPNRCGIGNANITGVDRALAAATVPLTVPVTGCPSAAFTAKESKPYRASFDGSGSSVGVSGRTLAKWHWAFGDGKTKVTTGPKVTHTYTSSKDRTVKLVVEDSAGALSAARTKPLKGSKLTIASKAKAAHGTRLALSGRLVRWHTTKALPHRALRLERCRANQTRCQLIATVHTNSTGHWKTKAKFSGPKPMFRISFNGGKGYVGTRAHRTVKQSASLPHTG
jgi:hypothetical protein